MEIQAKEESQWYISHAIYTFEYLENSQEKNDTEVLVWENVILIKASSCEEAYEKALKQAKMEDEVSSSVKWRGNLGVLKFKGFRNILSVYDAVLEDGVELEWYEYTVKKEEILMKIKTKEELQIFNPKTTQLSIE